MKITVEDVAEMCHELNRLYCAKIGDASQQPWMYAPKWQRDSVISGVRFHLENPSAGPSGSHMNWFADKEAEGWKYGPVKDADKKEHPCFVPYEALPEEQRVKDSLFTGVVHAMRHVIKE